MRPRRRMRPLRRIAIRSVSSLRFPFPSPRSLPGSSRPSPQAPGARRAWGDDWRRTSSPSCRESPSRQTLDMVRTWRGILRSLSTSTSSTPDITGIRRSVTIRSNGFSCRNASKAVSIALTGLPSASTSYPACRKGEAGGEEKILLVVHDQDPFLCFHDVSPRSFVPSVFARRAPKGGF